jgi:hypothetical protein
MHCDYVATNTASSLRMWSNRCTYPVHFNYLATVPKWAKATFMWLHLSSALKLLCYKDSLHSRDLYRLLHLSSALKLRCYSGIGYKKDRAPVASVQCTSTALHGCSRHAASMHPTVALVQCTSTTLRRQLLTQQPYFSGCIYAMH